MQKIVLFIEPSDNAHRTPFKVGHLFMNRFAIDEDAGFEIINVLELEKALKKQKFNVGFHQKDRRYWEYEDENKQKGMDRKPKLYNRLINSIVFSDLVVIRLLARRANVVLDLP